MQLLASVHARFHSGSWNGRMVRFLVFFFIKSARVPLSANVHSVKILCFIWFNKHHILVWDHWIGCMTNLGRWPRGHLSVHSRVSNTFVPYHFCLTCIQMNRRNDRPKKVGLWWNTIKSSTERQGRGADLSSRLLCYLFKGKEAPRGKDVNRKMLCSFKFGAESRTKASFRSHSCLCWGGRTNPWKDM